jgi:hypothetical protein
MTRAVCVAVLTAAVVMTSAGSALAMTGAEWRRQSEPVRRAYIDGVLDAWHGVVSVQESVGTRDRGIAVYGTVVDCLRDGVVLLPEVYALVSRHVDDNPGLHGKDMSDLIFSTLSQACRR